MNGTRLLIKNSSFESNFRMQNCIKFPILMRWNVIKQYLAMMTMTEWIYLFYFILFQSYIDWKLVLVSICIYSIAAIGVTLFKLSVVFWIFVFWFFVKYIFYKFICKFNFISAKTCNYTENPIYFSHNKKII